ncbi:hypothetical protein cyc_02053 [Cyclospora cayetanensis]|uniref:Uncharacterized protein n=1 Tax=Cyclospora cayetanensis TaxID=88456 RepID=A0A1D3D3V0_9EIME|nr:hypothetical protein cyc_02053 [Cyclospora cayetanensis]
MEGAAEGLGGKARSAGGKWNSQCFMSLIYRLKYRNLSPQFIAGVIKTGTICRTLWPLLPPLMLLQYIRQPCTLRFPSYASSRLALWARHLVSHPFVRPQTDAEMRSIEQLASAAHAAAQEQGTHSAPPILSFLDLRKPGWTGHWRFQQDLAIIRDRVNKPDAQN